MNNIQLSSLKCSEASRRDKCGHRKTDPRATCYDGVRAKCWVIAKHEVTDLPRWIGRSFPGQMIFDHGHEGWVGVCHLAAWSSLSLEVFRQKLNGHLSKLLPRDCWGCGGLATLVTSTTLPNPRFSNRARAMGYYCIHIYVTIHQHFFPPPPVLCLMRWMGHLSTQWGFQLGWRGWIIDHFFA